MVQRDYDSVIHFIMNGLTGEVESPPTASMSGLYWELSCDSAGKHWAYNVAEQSGFLVRNLNKLGTTVT